MSSFVFDRSDNTLLSTVIGGQSSLKQIWQKTHKQVTTVIEDGHSGKRKNENTYSARCLGTRPEYMQTT
jgi:hypothetical protein